MHVSLSAILRPAIAAVVTVAVAGALSWPGAVTYLNAVPVARDAWSLCGKRLTIAPNHEGQQHAIRCSSELAT